MDGRRWCILADKTLQFLSIAKESGFCLDLLAQIKRRLYSLSPFKIHH